MGQNVIWKTVSGMVCATTVTRSSREHHVDQHIYHPSHGTQAWPCGKLLTVKIARCTHDPNWYFWITPISYNVWIYSRWAALCMKHPCERKGIYRTEGTRLGRWG